MRLGTIAAVLLLTTSAPVFAQNLDALTEAFDKLPEIILSTSEPEQAFFVDIEALLEQTARQGAELTPGNVGRAQIGAMLRPVDALRYAKLEDWNDKAGIQLEDIRYFAGFGQVPNTVTVWGLQDDAAASGLAEDLTQRDFVPVGAEGILGNGEPLRIDVTRNDPGNPWRSKLGAATFAAVKDNAVIQATTPDALPMLLSDTPSLDRNLLVKAAINGLKGAVGDHLVVQAMLISPAFGMARIDPTQLLMLEGRDVDAVRDNLLAQVEAGSKGIPPYLSGIIADAQLDHPAVAISLTYGDCQTAEAAARLMEQRWVETMPEVAQGTTSIGTIPSDDKLCAATMTIVDDSTDHTINPIFDALFNAHMRRSFTVLQIGQSS